MMVLVGMVGLALAGPLSVDAAVDAAGARDVGLATAEAAVLEAGGAARADCGLRADPIVQGGVALVGEAWNVSIQQPVSLSGAGAAACRAARAEAEAATAALVQANLASAAATRRAWAAAVAAQQRSALAAEAQAAADAVLQATLARRAAGEVADLDVHLAHLHAERARTASLAAALAEAEAVGLLAARVGLAPGALDLPDDPLLAAPAPDGRVHTRGDVMAAEARAKAAEAGSRAATASALPPVRIGAFVEEEGGEFRAGPRVQLTLPVFNRGVADRGAAAGAALQAASQAEATRQRARAEQATAATATARVESLLAGQDADVPARARAALAGAAAAFAAGDLDLLQVSTLQAQVLDGHAAWLEGRRLAAEARVRALLAAGDVRLLGEG